MAIPLAAPVLAGNEAAYLQDCIASTYVSSVGPYVDRFQQDVAKAAGSLHGVATSAGTTALQAALVAVGVKRGDLVIMPSMTFIATLSAVHWSGADPWLFDIDPDSWTLDPNGVQRALEAEAEVRSDGAFHRVTGQRIAAIMPVYTLGNPADMDALAAIAATYGLPIVADAAAAIGATYRGRALGAMGADLSMISFNGNKTVTAGGGGAVVTNDAELARRVRHLTTTARVGADYLHDEIGFNYRMTNLQAAVGVAQLEQLEAFLKAKRLIRERYNSELAALPACEAFPEPDWASSACWFSGVVLPHWEEQQVSGLIGDLKDAGIDARPFWRPMHLQPPVKDALKTQTPVTDNVWYRVLTLPCSSNLSESDQAYVIEAVKRGLEARG